MTSDSSSQTDPSHVPAPSEAKPLVVVDARMVGEKPHGIARYVCLLAEGLKNRTLPYRLIFLVQSEQNALRDFEQHRMGAPFLHPKEGWEIPRALKTLNASLYHSPSFASIPFPSRMPCPWIQTVHDLNHLLFGSFAQRVYYSLVLKPFAKKAKCLATVSQTVQKELAVWTGFSPEQIEVVYNAIEKELLERITQEELREVLESLLGETSQAGIELKVQSYFLCVTNSKPHKNVPFLLEAYRSYRKKVSQPKPLVLTLAPGEGGISEEEGVLFVDSLTDLSWKALMQGALALVFPSLYEGFGRPPIEALVSGVPVLVSQIPPHEEVLGPWHGSDSIRFFNPLDIEECARSLQLAETGMTRPDNSLQTRVLEHYSVEKLAQKMDQLYRNVLGL